MFSIQILHMLLTIRTRIQIVCNEIAIYCHQGQKWKKRSHFIFTIIFTFTIWEKYGAFIFFISGLRCWDISFSASLTTRQARVLIRCYRVAISQPWAENKKSLYSLQLLQFDKIKCLYSFIFPATGLFFPYYQLCKTTV